MSPPILRDRGSFEPSIGPREMDSDCLGGYELCGPPLFSSDYAQNVGWIPLEDFVLFSKSTSPSIEREYDVWTEDGNRTGSPALFPDAPLLKDGFMDDDDTEVYLDHTKYYPLMLCGGEDETQTPHDKFESASSTKEDSSIDTSSKTVETGSSQALETARESLLANQESHGGDWNRTPSKYCGRQRVHRSAKRDHRHMNIKSDLRSVRIVKSRIRRDRRT